MKAFLLAVALFLLAACGEQGGEPTYAGGPATAGQSRALAPEAVAGTAAPAEPNPESDAEPNPEFGTNASPPEHGAHAASAMYRPDAAFIPPSSPVPIFMYHTSSEYEPGPLSALYVRPSEFELQLAHLAENGYTFVTFDDWDNLHAIERPVFITFDDGYRANYTEIFPIIERHGAVITIFLTLGQVRPDELDEDMVRRMSDSGLVKFESHTMTHADLASISGDADRLRFELESSRAEIEALTGREVMALAYPFGSFNDAVAEAAAEFYRFGLSIAPGLHCPREHDDFAMRRLTVHRSTSLRAFIAMLGD